MRDAYQQYREGQIKDFSGKMKDNPTYARAAEKLSFAAGSYMMNGGRFAVPDLNDNGGMDEELTADGRAYFIQVGTFSDPDKVDKLKAELNSIELTPVVKVYERVDYSIFGVQVAAGSNFYMAKKQEMQLAAAGYHGAFVVTR